MVNLSEPDPRAAESLLADELVGDVAGALGTRSGSRASGCSRPPRPRISSSALDARDQVALLRGLPPRERQIWMRQLPPDDAADVLQDAPEEERDALPRR